MNSTIIVVNAILLRPKVDPNSHGTLSFQTDPFSNNLGTLKENEKKPTIKIVRSGGSKGKVGATITIDESDDYYQKSPVSAFVDKESWPFITDEVRTKAKLSLKDFKNTSIPFFFKDGEYGIKPIPIPILDDNIFEGNEIAILQLTNPQSGVKVSKEEPAKLIIDDAEDFMPDQPPSTTWVEWCLIIITCLVLFRVALKLGSIRRKINASDDETAEDYTNFPRTIISPEVIQNIADEIQVVKAIKQTENKLGEAFSLINNDIPVTHRQMKQGWRHLRYLIREGVPTELDLEATIEQVGGQGFLVKPIFKPRRINKTELLLLIDQDGSMVPFHHLSKSLIETASRGGRFNLVMVYYYHNCPDEYLYKDPYHLEAVPIDDCLSQLPKTRVVCLIFSDAGAARGGFNSRRRRQTKFFLKELKRYVRHIAWLNPVPRQRWENTTAAEINSLIPMFEVNRQELYRAIDVLRGRYRKLELLIR